MSVCSFDLCRVPCLRAILHDSDSYDLVLDVLSLHDGSPNVGLRRCLRQQFRAPGLILPAEASKFRGITNFATMAQWHRVGRGGMAPFILREYHDKPPFLVPPQLARALDYFDAVLALEPAGSCG